MRIGQLAPLHEAVPPVRYGGTERVVSWLTEELCRRGHEVTLFASGDSRTSAKLVPVVPRALRLVGVADAVGPHILACGMLRERLHEFDVVHSHVDYFPFPMHRPGDPPLVTTIHGRLDLPEIAPVYRFFRNEQLISISDAQRAPLADLNWAATVHHGLPVANYPAGDGAGDYVLFLGRMSPEKRPHVAIDTARRAGIRLVLAAKVEHGDRPYFEKEIVPRLAGPGVDYVGETDLPRTIALLRGARALLFPILWPEPFGLVMIESMACGTPVITRRCGSTPEVVAHGEVGFVCDDDDQVVEALARIDTIDRRACRRWVEERFSVQHMADSYERVYGMIDGGRRQPWKTSSVSTTGTTSSRRPASRMIAPAS